MSSVLSKLKSLREHSAGAARDADNVAGTAALLASAGADYVIAAISVDMTAGLNDLIIDVLVIVLSIPPGKKEYLWQLECTDRVNA